MTIRQYGQRPGQIMRICQHPIWLDYEVGVCQNQQPTLVCMWHQSEGAFDCHSVRWDIFADKAHDLDEMLWKGQLTWKFKNADQVIGPLSMFSGVVTDLFSKGKRKEEQPLEALSRVEEEEAWYRLMDAHLLGRGNLHRGVYVYNQSTVMLPDRIDWAIELSFSRPIELKETVRMRVYLDGVFKRVVPVGK